MANTRKRAFTLVEVIIAFCVASVLIYVLHQMLFGGLRTFKRLEGKTYALESAMLAWEIIADDVRSNEYFGVQPEQFTDVRPIEIGEVGGKQVLGLMRLRRVEFANVAPKTELEKVIFSLEMSKDGDHGCLKRNDKVYKSIKLKKLDFHLFEQERDDGKKVAFLSLAIKGWSTDERSNSSLVGLLALDAYTLRKANPSWVEVRKRLYP